MRTCVITYYIDKFTTFDIIFIGPEISGKRFTKLTLALFDPSAKQQVALAIGVMFNFIFDKKF